MKHKIKLATKTNAAFTLAEKLLGGSQLTHISSRKERFDDANLMWIQWYWFARYKGIRIRIVIDRSYGCFDDELSIESDDAATLAGVKAFILLG